MFRAGGQLLKTLVFHQPVVRTKRKWNNRSIMPYLREVNKRQAVVELDHMLKQGKVPIPRRSSFTDWNYQAEMKALQARLGERFDQELLARAFVTESHVKMEMKKQEELGVEVNTGLVDNSKLAQEGQAVINEALGPWLRGALPLLPEEGIQAAIDYLTTETMMADIAFHLGMRDLILSEEYPPSASSFCYALQALVAALAKTDKERALVFVTDIIGGQIAGKDINEIWTIVDPMGILTKIILGSGLPAPESRLMWQTGPGTIFSNHMVGIFCNKEIIGESSGETLEIAEEMAARDALRNIFDTNEARTPLPFGQPASGSSSLNKPVSEVKIEAQNIVKC